MLNDEPSTPLEVRLCRQLWAAVFELAVDDAINDRHEARIWVESFRHEPGSFTWLCELFNYDSVYIKRELKSKYR